MLGLILWVGYRPCYRVLRLEEMQAVYLTSSPETISDSPLTASIIHEEEEKERFLILALI